MEGTDRSDQDICVGYGFALATQFKGKLGSFFPHFFGQRYSVEGTKPGPQTFKFLGSLCPAEKFKVNYGRNGSILGKQGLNPVLSFGMKIFSETKIQAEVSTRTSLSFTS